MGRIRGEFEINERRHWTLYDSGARNNYIVRGAINGLPVAKLPVPKKAAFGGQEHMLDQSCLVMGKVEGRSVDFFAYVVDEIGLDDTGKPIEVLFGALAMQNWGIRLDLPNERLDLTHYTRDFLEF